MSPLRSGETTFGSDAFGLEGESDFVIELVIPAHRLLFRLVGVHDGLVVDAIFPDRVFLRFFSRLCCQDSAHRSAPDLPGVGEIRTDALTQDLTLKLGEHREQAGHGSPGGYRQIECFSQRYETDAEMLQFL